MTLASAPDIFLSYSRKDLAIAGKMAAALSAAGHNVWWDQALKSGEVYDQVTETALREARVVVVLWSKVAVASDWVRSEATVAMQRGALMPVMLEPCQRPVMFELRQSADLTGWKGNARDPRLQAFLRDVARQLDAPVPATAPVPPPAPVRRLLPWLTAAALLLAALGAGWYFMGYKLPGASKPVIAVLPFTNLSDANGPAYFAEGLAEEILDTLARDDRLKVLGGITARAIRDNSANPDFARDKLGVTQLLEGSVRGGGGAPVKVSVRLIDTRDGSEIWGKVFNSSGNDVGGLQEQVAQAVAAQLAGQVGGAATVVAAKVPQAAYEKVLVARQLLRNREPDAILQARVLANEAVALAPEYAAAYAVRARAGHLAIVYSDVSKTERAATLRDAETAIRLDPSLAEGYTALGAIKNDMDDTPAAIAAYARALALKPEDADARLQLGRALQASCDLKRAIAELEKAVAIDPLWSLPVYNLIERAAEANQPDLARAAAKRFRALSPDPAEADLIDAHAAYSTGEVGRSVTLIRAAMARKPNVGLGELNLYDSLAALLAPDRISERMWRNSSDPNDRDIAFGRYAEMADRLRKAGTAAGDDSYDFDSLLDALMALDRPAEVVAIYDARFGTAAAFAASAFKGDWRIPRHIGIALDRVGRHDEAKAMLRLARAEMAKDAAKGQYVAPNAYEWAILQLAEGDRAGALKRLEGDVGPHQDSACFDWPYIGTDWVLKPLHGDPRFEALAARCRDILNTQRKIAGLPPLAG